LSYRCQTCGEEHADLPLVFGGPAPATWAQTPATIRAHELSELGSDQCMIAGRAFFVRGCLDLPIADHPEPFRWLVWVRVSAADMQDIVERWEASGREVIPPYDGELDSTLPGYEATVGLKVTLQTMPVGQRPQVVVTDPEHPLGREQRRGLAWDAAQSRSAALMHA
jgi:hypothetical protein